MPVQNLKVWQHLQMKNLLKKMLKKTPARSQPAGAPDVVNPILLGGKLMAVLQLTGAGIRDQHILHTLGSPCKSSEKKPIAGKQMTWDSTSSGQLSPLSPHDSSPLSHLSAEHFLKNTSVKNPDFRVVASCVKIYWPGVVVVMNSCLPIRKPWVTCVAHNINLLEQH